MTSSAGPLWILPQPIVDVKMLESRQKEGMSGFEEIWIREYLWTEWVPAHAGVKGNEAVDKLAKRAVLDTSIEMEVSCSRYEIKAIIKRWQQQWEIGNKGRRIFNTATSGEREVFRWG